MDGFLCKEEDEEPMAKSHHSDLRVIQFSAEMPSAFKGSTNWTGNERGEEEALLPGGQRSPRQSWA